MQNKSVTMIHPTFDNLADILRRHGVKLLSIDESKLTTLGEKDNNISTDALFLVCPNNPTGTELSKQEFSSVVNYCKKKHILLILDFSFRFYSKYPTWDQYALLQSSGVDFIVFEDTGKTWPTLDLKLGIMLSSESIYSPLLDITNDFLLNVSPFIFKLLTKYICVEPEMGMDLSPQETIKHNRQLLKKALAKSPLKITNSNSLLSVDWIKLPEGWRSSHFTAWLQEKGVFVLPGLPFYWDDIVKGESYIRVALARPKELFALGAKNLAANSAIYDSEA
jgi:aspartate/methionine/tyrosine aminotransferase